MLSTACFQRQMVLTWRYVLKKGEVYTDNKSIARLVLIEGKGSNWLGWVGGKRGLEVGR